MLDPQQQNLLKQVFFGKNYIPTPAAGEDPYDAFLNKQRNMTSRKLQSEALSEHPILKSMGVKSNPALTALGYAASSPDKGLGDMLSPILGGNPAKATRNIYEGMRGANTMGAFGRMSDITEDETRGVMDSINNRFYKQAKERLVGGAADNKPDKRYPKKELAKGVAHEQEHTGNKPVAKEIAKDHLEEDSNYYSTLDKYKIGSLRYAFEFLK
jgi:hypothetical protein